MSTALGILMNHDPFSAMQNAIFKAFFPGEGGYSGNHVFLRRRRQLLQMVKFITHLYDRHILRQPFAAFVFVGECLVKQYFTPSGFTLEIHIKEYLKHIPFGKNEIPDFMIIA